MYQVTLKSRNTFLDIKQFLSNILERNRIPQHPARGKEESKEVEKVGEGRCEIRSNADNGIFCEIISDLKGPQRLNLALTELYSKST